MSRRVKHSQALLIGKIVKTCILAAIGIVMVAPVVWMVSTSFKVEAEVFNFPIQWIPENPTFSNYIKTFTAFPYLSWYINTARNTVIIVIASLLFSSMAGFAFAEAEIQR